MHKTSFSHHHVLLGFDFGTKRIGVAAGQTVTQTARPLAVIAVQNGVPQWNHITQLIKEWQPDGLVVGLPLNMDETEIPQLTQASYAFSEQLRQRYQLPVYSMDERLSTLAAREHIFATGGYRALKKKSIDSVAAQLILESWLQQYNMGVKL